MHVGRHTTAQSAEIHTFGVHLSTWLTVGKERARMSRCNAPENFFSAVRGCPRPCARTNPWFRGQTLPVPGHGGGGTIVTSDSLAYKRRIAARKAEVRAVHPRFTRSADSPRRMGHPPKLWRLLCTISPSPSRCRTLAGPPLGACTRAPVPHWAGGAALEHYPRSP